MTVNEETRRLMSLDMARYYYEEVNRRNEDLIRHCGTSIARGYTLLSIVISVAAACTGYLSAVSAAAMPVWVLLAVCLLTAVILFLKVTRVHRHYGGGSFAAQLGINEFVRYYRKDCGLAPDRTMVELLCDGIDIKETDARGNEAVHRGILRWYRACVLFFVAGTALASIVAAAVAVL